MMTDLQTQLLLVGCKASMILGTIAFLVYSVGRRFPFACTTWQRTAILALLILPLAINVVPSIPIPVLTQPVRTADPIPQTITLNESSVETNDFERQMSTAADSIDLVSDVSHDNPFIEDTELLAPPMSENNQSATIAPVAILPLANADKSSTRQISAPQILRIASVLFYGIVSSLLILRLVGAWFALVRLRRTSLPIVDTNWQRSLEHWTSVLKIGREVELRLSDDVGIPMTFGWRCPVILVPRTCVSACDQIQREAILIHELTHILRSDFFWQILIQLTTTLYWWNPLMWIVRRSAESLRERLCDLFCSRHLGREAYAKALVMIATRSLPVRTMALGMAMAQGPSLRRRINDLTTQKVDPNMSSTQTRGALACGSAFVTLGLIVVGMLTTRVSTQIAARSLASNQNAVSESAESLATGFAEGQLDKPSPTTNTIRSGEFGWIEPEPTQGIWGPYAMIPYVGPSYVFKSNGPENAIVGSSNSAEPPLIATGATDATQLLVQVVQITDHKLSAFTNPQFYSDDQAVSGVSLASIAPQATTGFTGTSPTFVQRARPDGQAPRTLISPQFTLVSNAESVIRVEYLGHVVPGTNLTAANQARFDTVVSNQLPGEVIDSINAAPVLKNATSVDSGASIETPPRGALTLNMADIFVTTPNGDTLIHGLNTHLQDFRFSVAQSKSNMRPPQPPVEEQNRRRIEWEGELINFKKQVAVTVNREPIFISDILEPYGQFLEACRDSKIKQVEPLNPNVSIFKDTEVLSKNLIQRDVGRHILHVLFLQYWNANSTPQQREELQNRVDRLFEKELQRLQQDYHADSVSDVERELVKKGTTLQARKDAFVREKTMSEFFAMQWQNDPAILFSEILEYYRSHPAQFDVPGLVTWQQIYACHSPDFSESLAKTKLEQTVAAMNEGAAFDDDRLIPKYSQNQTFYRTSFAEMQKGSLTDVALETKLFSMPLNEWSEIIKSDSYCCVVRVIDRKEPHRKSLEESRQEIEEKLSSERHREFTGGFLRKMRLGAMIETKYDARVYIPKIYSNQIAK